MYVNDEQDRQFGEASAPGFFKNAVDFVVKNKWLFIGAGIAITSMKLGKGKAGIDYNPDYAGYHHRPRRKR